MNSGEKRKREKNPSNRPLKRRIVLSDDDDDQKAQEDEKEVKEKDAIIDGKTRFHVYILEADRSSEDKSGSGGRDYAYVGYTFENEHLDRVRKHGPPMRLAQHNGVISGGPPQTARHRPLRMIARLTGDPSWFTHRYALYLEKALQKMAPRGFVREAKWRKNPKSVSATWKTRFRRFPPPPQLPLFQKRGHAAACRQLNLMTWFLHHFKTWPTTTKPAKSKRGRRGRSEPLAPLSEEEHSFEIHLHADFWDADTIHSIEQNCRYWSPRFLPLSIVSYNRKKNAK